MSEAVIAVPQAIEPGPVPPDWAAIQEEIHCPLCEYNLRGLSAPRCPECGYAFVWSELLEIDRRLHPYLFEHHPERPIWSFVMTIIGGLRPWKFWKSLHPAQPCRPGRLAIYALWMLVPIMFVWFSLFGVVIAERAYYNYIWRQKEAAMLASPQRAPYVESDTKHYGGVEAYLDYYAPLSLGGLLDQLGEQGCVAFRYAVPSTALLLWPITSLGALLTFELSRRRARISRIQIVRTVVYSADIVWIVGILALALSLSMLAAVLKQLASVPSPFDLRFHFLFIESAIVLLYGIRLFIAYHYYLRFPHAVWVVLSSQAIAALVVAKAALAILTWSPS